MPSTLKTIPFLLALAFLFPAGESMAGSGKHKDVSIVNCSDRKLIVDTFNGDDKCGPVAHAERGIKEGKADTVRCHGKGKHRCYINVRDHWKQETPCEKIDLDKGGRLLIYATRKGTKMADGKSAWTQTKDKSATCEEGRETAG